jgi:hypothetical protein
MNNKFSKLKTDITAIILVLLMASVIWLALPSQVQAQNTYTNVRDGKGVALPAGVTPDVSIDTHPGLAFSPNVIGVGQSLLVNLWINPPVSNQRINTRMSVTFTKPDGTTVVKDQLESYAGDTTAWFEYVPDQVGTWKIKYDFPGQYFPAGNYTSGQLLGYSSYGQVFSYPNSCYYQPSSTAEFNFTVQKDQVMSWPPAPLPTDYWTRPVSSENREWKTIMGNWPWAYANNYAYGGPFVIAPNSAHIVWKRQDAIGGLAGAENGQLSFTNAGNTPSVIYAGRCYQTVTKPGVGSVAQCYDLRTGQVYYEIPTSAGGVTPTVISSKLDDTPAVQGATAVLGPTVRLLSIGTRIIEVDPFTGLIVRNNTGMSGTFYNDPYVLTVQDLGASAGANRYRLINWTAEIMRKGSTAVGDDNNFTSRIQKRSDGTLFNISFPFSSLGTCDFNAGISVTSQSITDGASGITMQTRLIGTSLISGNVLWNVTTDIVSYSGSTAVADNGKYCFSERDETAGQLVAWDLQTGQLAWKSDLIGYPWGFGGAYAVASAYGLVYRFSYAGVAAFSWETGKKVWQFVSPTVPFEAPWYPSQSFNTGAKVADGKIYVANSEHSASQPIARGWKLWCLNATTGENKWNITGSWGTPGPVADGYLTAGNGYDGYMYVFGKGKSATTVSAPQTAITQGQSVVLTGTVLDQSPAQPGKACVSKESMATYMEFLHMQKPLPANITITGVPVSLDAVDPNGNFVHIADVTSDMSGTYSYMWKPDMAGKYTVTATFMGDDSYGSSYAETAVGVVDAPVVTSTPTQTPITMPPFEIYTVGTGIAVIIAIAIVGLLILRKRP